MKTGVILQPSYIPWRGYFDLIHDADVFVFYDDVQYDKHGWRNRNRIKTAQGPQWLTIPTNASDKVLIKDAVIAQRDWARKHIATLRQSYARAPFLEETLGVFEPVVREPCERLADVTIALTIALARCLGIEHTRFVRSSELGVGGGKTERLVNILQHLGCDRYVSGPSARDYLVPSQFEEAKIQLDYKVYDYPAYEQLHAPYEPAVTVLDLLFVRGAAEAPKLIWSAL